MILAKIVSIKQLLKKNLVIPPYQRPYKWTIRNMQELVDDISTAIADSHKYGADFKYRIGTIILHEEKNNKYNIVDGQQRIISLILLNYYLHDEHYSCSILKNKFSNKISQSNIHSNYVFIKERFSLKNESKQQFLDAMENILEVVLIQVDKIQEAFQLFDSQNSRGKELDPHDLLKAYHLREMRLYPYEMEHTVKKWEEKNSEIIRDLFANYLFRIWNWSRCNKSIPFTSKEIDTYKGVSENSTYSYAKRAGKAMPYFQITEPFTAGNDFFEMVDHYINLLEDVESEIEKNPDFTRLNKIITQKTNSVGFKKAKNLFYCALLMYYDKFHNFDVIAIKKIFTWAFMLRVDMENLGFDSINKYAIGENPGSYTNEMPLFSRISLARVHSEISNLQVKVLRENDKAKNDKWNYLYNVLKSLNGY